MTEQVRWRLVTPSGTPEECKEHLLKNIQRLLVENYGVHSTTHRVGFYLDEPHVCIVYRGPYQAYPTQEPGNPRSKSFSSLRGG